MNQPSSGSSFANNVLDPSGTGQRGMTVGHDLVKSALGHPIVIWIPAAGTIRLLEIDVFTPPGAPSYLLIKCPYCNHDVDKSEKEGTQLRIMEGAKAWEYDPLRAPPMYPGWSEQDVMEALVERGIDIKRGGTLSVEPFSCTWEETPDLRRGFGLQRCPWQNIKIDKNVARPA